MGKGVIQLPVVNVVPNPRYSSNIKIRSKSVKVVGSCENLGSIEICLYLN